MTIETKFRPGDIAYYMLTNQIKMTRVVSTNINVTESGDVIVVYNVGPERYQKRESELFKSINELFEYLRINIEKNISL